MENIVKYPKPRKIIKEFEEFGKKRFDEYYWMRDIEGDPDVRKYLEAENKISKGFMKSSKELCSTIFKEMKSRELESYQTCPYKHGDYLYYEKFEPNKEYAIHCRRKIGSDKEEICLDENMLAEGHDYFSLGIFELTTDHKILAYSVDFDGSEIYTMKFRDLETGLDLPEQIENTYPSAAWFNNSRAIAYTLQNDKQRPYQACSFDLTTKEERIVFQEDSGEFFVSVNETSDHQYMTILSNGSITSEYHFLDGADFKSEVRLFQSRRQGMEYYIDHKEGYFYIITNDEHENYRVARAKAEQTDALNWEEYIAGSDKRYINDFLCFKNFSVLNYKEDGLNKIQVVYNDLSTFDLEFPEKAYYVGGGDNAEYDTQNFRYNYYSPIKPLTSFDFDTVKRTAKQVYQKSVPGFDPNNYEVKRVEVASHDGALVPMTIIHKKGIPLDGSNPALLYGYGSYGICIDPYFSQKIFSLVDRGVIYAIAHVRGSATLGRKWYEDGKFLKKKNTFLDFIECAKSLISSRYTSRGKITIQGGSAGGMLVGATINIAEEGLFNAAVAEVPFVDVLNTMLDDTLPLTELEYDEWGNPKDQTYYDYIKSYSPYDNIQKKKYPAILAMAGLNDPRVTYWEPMKWIYKLRDFATDSNPKLLHTNMEAGHAGVTGRFEYLKEDAFVYGFILKTFGIDS